MRRQKSESSSSSSSSSQKHKHKHHFVESRLIRSTRAHCADPSLPSPTPAVFVV